MLKKRRKVRKRDKRVFFKSKDKNLKKLRKRRKRKALKEKMQPRKILTWAIILLLSITTIYLINRLLDRNSEEILLESETVLGLEEIPVFPGSTFLYVNNMTNESVKDLLSGGESVYVINDKSDFKDVKMFYANELTSLGWNLVLDVEIGSEDKRFGQYWTKEDRGLRIYTKYNDIWYEYITAKEAENGLSNRVSDEIEIDMLLAGSDYQELLPDYPWQIKVPKEYLISYNVSEFEDLRAVNFQRISSGKFITLYPVAYWASKPLDFQVEEYTEILSQGTQQWSIINTTLTSWRGNSSLVGSITSGDEQREIMLLKNEKNKVSYILSAADSSDPLYEYIIENIKYLGQEDSP